MARMQTVSLGACLLLAGAIVLSGCGGKGEVAATTTATAPRHAPKLPPNAVRVEWKNEALVPAPRAGRVCIVTYKTGRLCARYAFGEIPAAAMKRKLRAGGWILVSSK